MSLILCVGTVSAKKEKKVETSYRNALIFAYSQVNSVFEDENIKLEIYNQGLWVTNKTKKTLFIDLAQCFLTHNGSSRPIYAKDQDERKASKGGFSTSNEEFLTIAPSTGMGQNETFICPLSDYIFGYYTTVESPMGDFTDYDKRLYGLIDGILKETQQDAKGKQYIGTVARHLTEDESINNIGASIAYAFNKRAEEWTSVELSTWVCDVIFAPYYIEKPEDLKAKDKKGFAVKETNPLEIHIKADSPFEFDEDRSPIIACDWVGNYKKGTFKLERIQVKKVPKTGLLVNILTAGTAAMAAQLVEDYYKVATKFDGVNENYGKMIYAPTIESTKQRIK